MTIRKNSSGFTLVELMIASTVFSVVLVLVSTGIVQIGNRYYKTTLSSRTQTAARNIVDEISRGIQFSGIEPVIGPGYFCINNIRYDYRAVTTATTRSSGANSRTFVASPQMGACNPTGFPALAPTGERNLLAPGMRLQKLDFSYNPTTRIAEMRVRVITTPETAFDMVTPAMTATTADPNATCSGGSSHLCAVSELSTVIQKRVQ